MKERNEMGTKFKEKRGKTSFKLVQAARKLRKPSRPCGDQRPNNKHACARALQRTVVDHTQLEHFSLFLAQEVTKSLATFVVFLPGG